MWAPYFCTCSACKQVKLIVKRQKTCTALLSFSLILFSFLEGGGLSGSEITNLVSVILNCSQCSQTPMFRLETIGLNSLT